MEWKLSGMMMDKYKKVLLEKRFFSSPFQPLPYMELANSPVLIQNYGWK